MRLVLITILTLLIAILIGVGLFYLKFQKEKTNEIENPDNVVEENFENPENYTPPEPSKFTKDLVLVKTEENSEIYWIQNQKKYPILDQKIIKLMQGIKGWDSILKVNQKDLAQLQKGPEFIAANQKSDGILLKPPHQEFSFIIKNGKRHYLEKEKLEANYDIKDVIVVSPRILKLIPPDAEINHISLQEAAKIKKIQIFSSGQFFENVAKISMGPFEQNTAVNFEIGDVLLSKSGKQSLILTQANEIFVPQGEKIILETLLGACIDRFKKWPEKNEILDVVPNLKDWQIKSGSFLLDLLKKIDEKNVHKENFAQEAIWWLTDGQKPKEKSSLELLKEAGIDIEKPINFIHLSNPRPQKNTSFVLAPEISLPGLIANYFEKCPENKINSAKIICLEEIEFATQLYLQNKNFPQSDLLINAKTLSYLIAFYLTQKPIDEPLPLVAENQIKETAFKIIESLKNKNISLPNLNVAEIRILPDRTLNQDFAVIEVLGQGIKSIKATIKNVEKVEVLETPEVFGNLLEITLKDKKNDPLKPGFYFFTVKIWGLKGEFFESDPNPFVIQQE
jgi:hypothetical protein